MRILATFFLLNALHSLGLAQYLPLPKGVSKPGEHFLQLVVPHYSVSRKPFSEVLQELRNQYGMRFSVEITGSDPQLPDPNVTVDVRNGTIQHVLNEIVRATGYSHTEWRLGSGPANSCEILLGMPAGEYPLYLPVHDWSAPPDTSPENVLANAVSYIPELEHFFYPKGAGVIGSRYPAARCRLILTMERGTVRELIEELSQIANKSWFFSYDPEKRRLRKWKVF